MVKFGHTHYANFPRSKCPVEPHLYQVIKASEPGGGGGGGGGGGEFGWEYLGKFLLGMCHWPLRAPTPL